MSAAMDLALDAYKLSEQARDEGQMLHAHTIALIASAVATVQAAGHQTPSYADFAAQTPTGKEAG